MLAELRSLGFWSQTGQRRGILGVLWPLWSLWQMVQGFQLQGGESFLSLGVMTGEAWVGGLLLALLSQLCPEVTELSSCS